MAAACLTLRSEINARFDIPLGIRHRDDRERIPTGIPAIDDLAAGGIPRGTLTEICGPESSGRTSLLLALAARATRRAECIVWIDASGTFDPASAAKAGSDLERILWVNCSGNTEHALKASDLLIQAGGFGVIVLDLADVPLREARRISVASWFRLRHAAERTNTAFIAASAVSNTGSCAALQIELKRRRPFWAGKLLTGVLTQAESSRRNHRQTAEFLALS